ncbi:aromatic ring-hydroxylating dioxygenase subunit alpha [Hydrogenophaga sp. BPS33]|uniref:aromatic ring-hydroxylating dioxygenase subunit alpha n=1 Tax=Hydrogenophaga sp. BPS33 TaxID=2651974 RepID=UPI00131FAF4A|nr:aromatic ring-hydroxylating dioxygenase subunit alpha [Hydrogenophaga sp. BPS33]QHE84580.1 aromatic ring-hydroxylating dioxygenase subunit alpha [Hydrogenophaga sp. BPS33]
MLKKEQNELVTRTSAGTPMGEMFRRYWLPALLSEELAEPDGPPVRVQLLGERLIAIRDTQGRLGVMDEFCAHRGVSLWFGRNEENGLRCPYHGWKYDVSGRCVDVPSEPEGSRLCERIALKSYPLIERGGVIWIYMGPPELQPPPPEWEFATVPAAQSFTSKRVQECNWLQALEGGIDSSHVSFLHSGGLNTDPLFKGAKGNEYNMNDLRPQFEVTDTEGGLFIGVRRKAEPGSLYWRITPWIMPCFTMVPPRGDHPVHGHFWVPIDDENCWAWSFDYHPTRALKDSEVQAMKNGAGIHCKYVPGTYIPLANKSNDYLMDRAKQRTGELYSGVESIAIQDSSLQESMGPVQDRTREHLTGTDRGIVQARRRLIAAATALAESGTAPPGNEPHMQKVRSAAVVLPEGQAFQEAAREALRAEPGKPHATV